ncbi:MAG TPA: LysR family substrate-binding domain-containing protein [Candidatus Acidoferrales bacterium]|nr:LysR family substrate-binding domain-containing protein [Candidatus Acidoferrales bacterium]
MARVAHASGLASQANRGIVGQLVLGYTPARTNMVAKVVKAFGKLCPNVRMSLRDMTGHNIQLIRDGRIDVGFFPLPVDKTGLIVETLLREKYVVAMPKKHRLAGRQSISIRELTKEPNLLFPRYTNPVGYDIVVGLCQMRGLSLDIVLEVENVHMRVELVREGFGVCVLRTSTAEALHGSDIVFRPLQNSPILKVGMAYSLENRSHALPLFTDCVKQTLAN